MPRINTIVIGGGHAGLAMSRCLTHAGVEHVVLERGRPGERWRSERWDSLHLLTPRWLSRLPGMAHDGPDPKGFMSRSEVVRYLDRYAASFPAPLRTGVEVTRLERRGRRFRLETDQGEWAADHVVIATGECDRPWVPAAARSLSPSIRQVVPSRYRNPQQLEPGGVLVVGASATGIQLAAEIHASGRPVTLAVGQHTRLPRRYRERDILWWLERMGLLDQRPWDVKSLAASRDQPSMQLVGSPDHRSVDLNTLHASGVRVVGRVLDLQGTRAVLEDDLGETTAAADVKLARLRLRIDQYIDHQALASAVGPEEPFVPVRLPDPPTALDLRDAGIRTVLWATGFRRSYPWLQVAVLDEAGDLIHQGGVTAVDGLYAIGFNFLRRRSSTFIYGAGRDAEELTERLVARRGRRGAA